MMCVYMISAKSQSSHFPSNSFLMNLHIEPRCIYLTRHGESMYNTLGRIGGDSPLSPRGLEYAQRLKRFMDRCVVVKVSLPDLPQNPPPLPPINSERTRNLKVWTSTLLRTIQTAAPFGMCEVGPLT